MTPANILTAIVTAIYLGVAVSHFIAGAHGLGVAFVGYAFANVGLIMAGWQ